MRNLMRISSTGTNNSSHLNGGKVIRPSKVRCSLENMESGTDRKNCTERLIFCIDLSNEMDSLDFCRGVKKNYPTRLDLVKSALKTFVYTKQKINPNHEYAMCVLTDGAIWYQDFTTDFELFSKNLNNLQSQGEFQMFNMSSLFELFQAKFPEILTTKDTFDTAELVYRAIFIYARSSIVPVFQGGKKLAEQMLDSPIFFFDALYLHSKPSKDNRPQEVYDFITELEGKDHCGYFFENSTSVRKFHLHSTELLAHPLQRPEQSQFKTSLIPNEN